MSAAAPNNPRAALLAGLRTGGVRSASSSAANAVPHTAGPTITSFSVPRLASAGSAFQPPTILEDDSQAQFASYQPLQHHHLPLATSVDAGSGRFGAQQQHNMNMLRQVAAQRAALSAAAAVAPMQQPFTPNPQGAAALQMQVMQMEIMRLQALHQAQAAQQYQLELLAQAQQKQQQQQARPRRNFTEPSTAGPTTTSFSQATPTFRPRAQQTTLEQLTAKSADPPPVPMTAALGGKFGSRSLPAGIGSGASSTPAASQLLATPEEETPKRHGTAAPSNTPTTPSYGHTTIISGGTSLGPTSSITPSKSDSAVSWRRTSALPSNSGSPAASPAKAERISPPPGPKARPQPLRFSVALSAPAVPDIAIIEDDQEGESETDSDRRGAASEPTTPPSAGSSLAREEASRKMYDGLGIGRPANNVPMTATLRQPSSSAVRQPRGPPSGADELGPRNFATRIRRKAIGGLGVLMGARERREAVEVEAY